jgi:hypothetical protein
MTAAERARRRREAIAGELLAELDRSHGEEWYEWVAERRRARELEEAPARAEFAKQLREEFAQIFATKTGG